MNHEPFPAVFTLRISVESMQGQHNAAFTIPYQPPLHLHNAMNAVKEAVMEWEKKVHRGEQDGTEEVGKR